MEGNQLNAVRFFNVYLPIVRADGPDDFEIQKKIHGNSANSP